VFKRGRRLDRLLRVLRLASVEDLEDLELELELELEDDELEDDDEPLSSGSVGTTTSLTGSTGAACWAGEGRSSRLLLSSLFDINSKLVGGS
jgi:hypothetical protein